MAHVENTVMDVYYRNDSMKSVRVGVVSWVLAEGFAGAKPWGSGSTNKVAYSSAWCDSGKYL